ncbi:MAG: deoxyribonuclease IV [Planctomycetota bacterium]|nr:deoxyribonuclease IV [Planctomycetota bacterium]
MFGSHLSIAGGMEHALLDAETLSMDCVQIFTKNQRQWNVKLLTSEEEDVWLTTLKRIGWFQTNRVVSHNSYLINMASPDSASRKKSNTLQRIELERCEALAIPYCIAHPGARLGTPRNRGEPNELDGKPNKEEERGLARIVKSLDSIHNSLKGYKTRTCLETTVGSGTNLGYDFAHLGWIKERVKEPERIGYCFDTCHVTASGYDMTTDAKAKAVLNVFDEFAGLNHIDVFHFNDSIGKVGSRLDRHAHIGDGTCGLSCFRAILRDKRFDDVPKILETSKEENKKGVPMDNVNIAKLRRMANKARKSR